MQRKTIALSAVLILFSFVFSACFTKPESVETESPPLNEEGNSGQLAESNMPAYGSCGLGLVEDTSTDDAIRAVVRAEGQFVVEQNIDALMALWADGSYIKNAKNSVDDQSDDQIWNDVDAIRHRYVRTVFPGAPSKIQPADLEIDVLDDKAIVIATTRIGDEISPSGDRWELQQQAGCWMIHSLSYNLEPN